MANSKNITEIALLVAFGAAEGYAMYESRLTHPTVLRSQMTFHSFVVMKMFLSALGTSMVTQAAFSRIAGSDRFESTRGYRKTTLGMVRIFIGCFVLGVGMTLAGSGPTMTPVQLGSMVPDAPMTFLGCLVGTAVAVLLEPFIPNMILPWDEAFSNNAQVLDDIAAVTYESLAFTMGSVILFAALGLDYVIPHAADLAKLGIAPGLVHPIAAGLVVGLNQIPIRVISGVGQGGTYAYTVITSTISGGVIAPGSSLFYHRDNWYAPAFVVAGLGLGGYLAGQNSVVPAGPSRPFLAFIGGVLMLLGGKVARGCTCGRGISGFSELSVPSMVGTVAIFAGAMVMAAIPH